jgi:hypothetical protein
MVQNEIFENSVRAVKEQTAAIGHDRRIPVPFQVGFVDKRIENYLELPRCLSDPIDLGHCSWTRIDAVLRVGEHVEPRLAAIARFHIAADCTVLLASVTYTLVEKVPIKALRADLLDLTTRTANYTSLTRQTCNVHCQVYLVGKEAVALTAHKRCAWNAVETAVVALRADAAHWVCAEGAVVGVCARKPACLATTVAQ